jgi:hypothetical protein
MSEFENLGEVPEQITPPRVARHRLGRVANGMVPAADLVALYEVDDESLASRLGVPSTALGLIHE